MTTKIKHSTQLSNREQEVYSLLVTTTLDRAGIAKELHIAIGTVNSHMLSIFQKKNVNSTKELIIQHYKCEGKNE